MGWAADAEKDRLALAILAGFFIARLVFAFSLGLGIDESYTLAISRLLSLSYFDHPPLHQWIAHFAALAVGENVVARLPFIAMFSATGWIYYRLTCELFGPRAALIGLFALNRNPLFLRLRRKLDRPRWPVASCVGDGRVRGRPPILHETAR